MALGVYQDGIFQPNVFQIGTATTSTAILQLPVNCVMAGEQDDPPPGQRKGRLTFRQGRAQGRSLRHTFNE